MIRFIIGLGNPEPRYEQTPHNIGRVAVERLAQQQSCAWRSFPLYELAQNSSPAFPPDASFVRLKTYMNLSGQAVSELLRYFKVGPESILVCLDDFDIPLGQLRLRKKGSAGTHNGLKSIIEHLHSQDFARLRLGVGPIPPHSDAAQFVLSPFAKSVRPQVEILLNSAAQAIETVARHGLDAAMNSFNSIKP